MFLTPVLGSQPGRDVASEYLAKKAGFESLPEDELETLPDALDKGTTMFHRNGKGTPVLSDYMVKGFLKNAGHVLNGRINGIKALKSKVNNLVFVSPRILDLHLPRA